MPQMDNLHFFNEIFWLFWLFLFFYIYCGSLVFLRLLSLMVYCLIFIVHYYFSLFNKGFVLIRFVSNYCLLIGRYEIRIFLKTSFFMYLVTLFHLDLKNTLLTFFSFSWPFLVIMLLVVVISYALFKNDIRVAVLTLIFYFILIGFLIILLGQLDFFALLYLIIYVGAIAVLFLFSLKILPVVGKLVTDFNILKYIWCSLFIGLFLLLFFGFIYEWRLQNWIFFLNGLIFVDFIWLERLFVDNFSFLLLSFSYFSSTSIVDYGFFNLLDSSGGFSSVGGVVFVEKWLTILCCNFSSDFGLLGEFSFFSFSQLEQLSILYCQFFSIYSLLLIFNQYPIISFILALLLLVVMLGALQLILNKRPLIKYQSAYIQHYRHSNSIFLII